MKPDRCLGNLLDLLAAMESDEAPKDSAMLGDHDGVEKMDDNVAELGTVPAVGVKAVGVRSHVFIFPIHAVRAERQAKTSTRQTAANREHRH